MAAIFYAAYSAIRDLRGATPVSAAQAFTNARRVIGIERAVGIFREQQLQHLFLRWTALVELLNDVYNTAHFVVPVAILTVLFLKAPDRYHSARNTLAITTALALAGFAFFPLMPPRLLPANYHFIDTLKTVGGLWSFDSGPVATVSNQYAAMPSLHMAWATWAALVTIPTLRTMWQRLVAASYPAITLLCIVVTANHYFLDAAAGVMIVGVAWSIQQTVKGRTRWRISRGSNQTIVAVTSQDGGVSRRSSTCDPAVLGRGVVSLLEVQA